MIILSKEYQLLLKRYINVHISPTRPELIIILNIPIFQIDSSQNLSHYLGNNYLLFK